MDVKNINTTALAYIGDAVYEVYIREYVISKGNYNVDNLHKSAIKYVKAPNQAKVLIEFMNREGFLTEEEMSLARRGRNHKIHSKAKNATPIEYKNATGFESLIGYTHLKGDIKREEELVEEAIKIIEGGVSYE